MKNRNKQGLKPEDEKKLKELIEQNKVLFEQLSSRYLLKDDLVEVTNRSYSASKIIQNEIDSLRNEINHAISRKDSLEQGIAQLSQLNSQLEKFQNLVEQEYSENVLLIDYMEDILNKENVNEIEKLKREIVDFHHEIYNNDDVSIDTRIRDFLLNMDKAQRFLEETVEFNGVPVAKKDVLKKQYEQITDYYDDLFGESEEYYSKVQALNAKISELESFHSKIFGDEKRPSLQKDLDRRLRELEEVENEARKVINLASDAGLAGGFVEKAKEAKENKWWSVVFLISSLLIMFFYNRELFNNIPDIQNQINNGSIIWVILKMTVNAPLLWLAVVANINLNKYSRLEQDYAHKEALAKSYERYKTEISKLSSEDERDESLKQELIKINLEAFKLNPADNMETAKSDTFIDKILAIKYLNNEQNHKDKE